MSDKPQAAESSIESSTDTSTTTAPPSLISDLESLTLSMTPEQQDSYRQAVSLARSSDPPLSVLATAPLSTKGLGGPARQETERLKTVRRYLREAGVLAKPIPPSAFKPRRTVEVTGTIPNPPDDQPPEELTQPAQITSATQIQDTSDLPPPTPIQPTPHVQASGTEEMDDVSAALALANQLTPDPDDAMPDVIQLTREEQNALKVRRMEEAQRLHAANQRKEQRAATMPIPNPLPSTSESSTTPAGTGLLPTTTATPSGSSPSATTKPDELAAYIVGLPELGHVIANLTDIRKVDACFRNLAGVAQSLPSAGMTRDTVRFGIVKLAHAHLCTRSLWLSAVGVARLTNAETPHRIEGIAVSLAFCRALESISAVTKHGTLPVTDHAIDSLASFIRAGTASPN